MFTGHEYQSEFTEVCQKLAGEAKSESEVKNALIGLEWIIWEAIRGALIQGSAVLGFGFVFIPAYALGVNPRENWSTGLFLLCLALAAMLLIYWTLRLSLFLGLTKHVRSHRFGKLDFQNDPTTD
ncbi:MAG: hypothetical protein O9322_02920 [Beijerinckiaceae bacterium]|nr:hypothetical protein [Beijerinckiaceae bacterium]MCZ8301516.1 hypothetical protein [Beijerinckiaceae bacterium]